jgi:hypothetical protein
MSPLPVIVMKFAVVVAFQEQSAPVITEKIASPPAEPNDRDELLAEKDKLVRGITVYEQLGGALGERELEPGWHYCRGPRNKSSRKNRAQVVRDD